MRRLFILAAVAIVLGALGFALWPKPLVVETAVVATGAIDVTVDDEGLSRIRDVYTVSTPISGDLQRIARKAGDAVAAGATVVATIRPAAPPLLDARARRQAEAAIDAASAAVELAFAQVKQAEAQAAFLDGEQARAQELVRKGTISQRTYDKAVLDAAVARADVDRARANLDVQRRALDSAQAVLIDGLGAGSTDAATCCVDVTAPVSGTVLRVVTQSAQVVPAGAPLVELGNPQDLEIAVNLLSRDAVGIAVGAPATIDGWGGAALRATVSQVDPAAVTKVSALGIEEQRVAVVLKLVDPPAAWQRLGHDFRVAVHIVVWHGDNLTLVPLGALFRKGEAWAVFKADGPVAREQIVEIGARNGDVAEVKSGLAAGDVVIVHPNDTVQDGSRISH